MRGIGLFQYTALACMLCVSQQATAQTVVPDPVIDSRVYDFGIYLGTVGGVGVVHHDSENILAGILGFVVGVDVPVQTPFLLSIEGEVKVLSGERTTIGAAALLGKPGVEVGDRVVISAIGGVGVMGGEVAGSDIEARPFVALGWGTDIQFTDELSATAHMLYEILVLADERRRVSAWEAKFGLNWRPK